MGPFLVILWICAFVRETKGTMEQVQGLSACLSSGGWGLSLEDPALPQDLCCQSSLHRSRWRWGRLGSARCPPGSWGGAWW